MAATAHGTTCIFSSEKLNEEVMKIDIHGLSAEQVCPVDWLSCANALRRTAVKVSRVFAPRSTRLLIYLGSNRIFCAPRLWQINLNKSALKKLAASLRGFTEPCKVITSRLWNMQPFGSAGCCSAFFFFLSFFFLIVTEGVGRASTGCKWCEKWNQIDRASSRLQLLFARAAARRRRACILSRLLPSLELDAHKSISSPSPCKFPC